MGSDNTKAVKQCVNDAKDIKKSYDEIKHIAGCWKDAIENAEKCGGNFFQKAFNVSCYLDYHCHYDNDNDDNDDHNSNYSNDSNNSNNSNDSNNSN